MCCSNLERKLHVQRHSDGAPLLPSFRQRVLNWSAVRDARPGESGVDDGEFFGYGLIFALLWFVFGVAAFAFLPC